MRAVIQRVSRACVRVDGTTVGEIGRGLVILLGIRTGDDESAADYIVEKSAALRIFADDAGKMNLSVEEISGAVLVVSGTASGEGETSGVAVALGVSDVTSVNGDDPGVGVGLTDSVVTSAEGDASGVGLTSGVAKALASVEVTGADSTVGDGEGSGVASGLETAVKLGIGFGPTFSSSPSRFPFTFVQSCSIRMYLAAFGLSIA